MKWRLLAAFAGLITVVLLAQDLPLINYLRTIEFERVIAGLERDAFLFAGSSEDVLSEPETVAPTDIADLNASLDLYSRNEGGRVVIVDADGLLVASSDPTDEAGTQFANPHRPEFAQALTGEVAFGERNSNDLGGDLVYVAVPVLSGADIVGAVRITYPSAVIDQRTREKTQGLVLVGIISLLGAAFAAFLIASSFTSPIRRLQRTTESIAEGHHRQRAAENQGPPEIRSLARSFNSMTSQIEGLLEQQKAFAGDASHQLRTPLTALRLQLERAADMVDTDPEGARERVEAATEETERLQRLVEGLLMIARSEGSKPSTEPVDVSALVADRYEVWEPFAAERGVHLAINAPAGLYATAVPNALEQIVDNYVDNAIGAASSGDTITVIAQHRGDAVEVHVVDEGPGLSDDHLARVFDRFWRAPDAPHGGSGIGLAVVQQLARSSGGEARLANRSGTAGQTGIDASVTLRSAD